MTAPVTAASSSRVDGQLNRNKVRNNLEQWTVAAGDMGVPAAALAAARLSPGKQSMAVCVCVSVSVVCAAGPRVVWRGMSSQAPSRSQFCQAGRTDQRGRGTK